MGWGQGKALTSLGLKLGFYKRAWGGGQVRGLASQSSPLGQCPTAEDWGPGWRRTGAGWWGAQCPVTLVPVNNCSAPGVALGVTDWEGLVPELFHLEPPRLGGGEGAEAEGVTVPALLSTFFFFFFAVLCKDSCGPTHGPKSPW